MTGLMLIVCNNQLLCAWYRHQICLQDISCLLLSVCSAELRNNVCQASCCNHKADESLSMQPQESTGITAAGIGAISPRRAVASMHCMHELFREAVPCVSDWRRQRISTSWDSASDFELFVKTVNGQLPLRLTTTAADFNHCR